MFNSNDKDQRDEKTMARKENVKKDLKLSANDVSEDKNENTEPVASVTQPRINTEGL
ncbi:hypothetical protein [Paenisporosarcina indica]|uniref:hypothetical protein n=1 Tax=Paenisporosarcina indica TaxID=650093 RepID=UPI000B0F7805|nr:hypothetical protein [Paenisporosarcina indica]